MTTNNGIATFSWLSLSLPNSYLLDMLCFFTSFVCFCFDRNYEVESCICVLIGDDPNSKCVDMHKNESEIICVAIKKMPEIEFYQGSKCEVFVSTNNATFFCTCWFADWLIDWFEFDIFSRASFSVSRSLNGLLEFVSVSVSVWMCTKL